jgi:hypothetical protein
VKLWGTLWAAVLIGSCLVAVAGLAGGCGSRGPHLPHVTASAVLSPNGRRVTIHVQSSGSGHGIGQAVLTYPDGHRAGDNGGQMEDGVGWSYWFGPLRPGRYQWAVYAVARNSTPKYAIFPDDARTAQNVVTSGTVVIK